MPSRKVVKLLGVKRYANGVWYHRIYLPNLYTENVELTNTPPPNAFMLDKEAYKLEAYDAIMYDRFIDQNPALTYRILKQIGLPIIVDIDDFWELDQGHRLYDQYKVMNMPRSIIQSIECADLVTTTHKHLAKQIEPYNEKVRVLPNGLTLHEGQFTPQDKNYEGLRIGWCGGHEHEKDIAMLETSLQHINRKLDVGVVYGGYNKDSEASRRICKSFTGNNRKVKVIPPAKLHQYAFMYDHWDISLIPLQNTTFNRCKSNLKLLEAGFKKTAAIVSGIHPYAPDLQDGVNCIKIDPNADAKAWFRAVRELVNNATLRETLAENLHAYVVENYSLETSFKRTSKHQPKNMSSNRYNAYLDAIQVRDTAQQLQFGHGLDDEIKEMKRKIFNNHNTEKWRVSTT